MYLILAYQVNKMTDIDIISKYIVYEFMERHLIVSTTYPGN